MAAFGGRKPLCAPTLPKRGVGQSAASRTLRAATRCPYGASLTRQPVRHLLEMQGRDEERAFSGPNKERSLGAVESLNCLRSIQAAILQLP